MYSFGVVVDQLRDRLNPGWKTEYLQHMQLDKTHPQKPPIAPAPNPADLHKSASNSFALGTLTQKVWEGRAPTRAEAIVRLTQSVRNK